MIGYDQARATALRSRALETIAALPGVTAVSHATRLPLAPDITMDGLKIPGQHSASDRPVQVDIVAVGPNYFRTVGVPIVAGRDFRPDEIREGLRVVVVNETMARRYWPDGSAVGRRIHLGELEDASHEIIGIAHDHAVRSVGEGPLKFYGPWLNRHTLQRLVRVTELGPLPRGLELDRKESRGIPTVLSEAR